MQPPERPFVVATEIVKLRVVHWSDPQMDPGSSDKRDHGREVSINLNSNSSLTTGWTDPDAQVAYTPT